MLQRKKPGGTGRLNDVAKVAQLFSNGEPRFPPPRLLIKRGRDDDTPGSLLIPGSIRRTHCKITEIFFLLDQTTQTLDAINKVIYINRNHFAI